MSQPSTGTINRIQREIERNAVRARNGIKYLIGGDWTTPHSTPKDIVWQQGDVKLWRYHSDKVSISPPLLLFIGLVSRSSIFDLHEKVSFVRNLRDEGFDVFVLDWGTPGPGDADNTLETYVCRYLPRAVRAVLRASGATDLTVLGYCMGGNLALLAAASQPKLPIRNLITMATAVDFSQMPAQFGVLRDPNQDLEAFIDGETGCISPNLIEAAFRVRKPTAAAAQYANLLENLFDDTYVEGHQAIARWTSDHIPLPGGVARQVVESWIRQNSFVNGTLRVAGRPATLESIRCPVLSIVATRDEIVPLAAAQPMGALVGSSDFEMLKLDAGHISLVIGRGARKVVLPKILAWLIEHSEVRES
ncbi:alpha/beta fold hydrolase [Rhodococcus sp. NPDC019627]|uniref:alpha/beta fold hydrolase n=1 Tax=unclassified Rhodococcus (in: high G+C Gram-positive bacteria) TaxID=192944 RepID=UPI0033D6DAB9